MSRRLDLQNGMVEMAHGAGGRATTQLVDELFRPAFDNQWLSSGEDGACVELASNKVVISCDAHVVSPLFFPGGDIGALAVNGTVNDVAMMGALPRYLSASFVLEEGFSLSTLQRIVTSMAEAARGAGVAIVTGDTKVVERGKGDGVYISTTGIGERLQQASLSAVSAQSGDQILVSGPVGDHGVAVLSCRENLQFETQLLSDCTPLHTLVQTMLSAVPTVRCLRDPTRGGLATALNELAAQSRVGMRLQEAQIPVRDEVAAACDLLGLDPLYMACEGRLLAICPADKTQDLLRAMQAHPQGKTAAVIGEVIAEEKANVVLQTRLGGHRRIDWLADDPLPRIC